MKPSPKIKFLSGSNAPVEKVAKLLEVEAQVVHDLAPVERCGGVVHGQIQHAFPADRFAVFARNGNVGFDQRVQRMAAKGADDFRFDLCDLREKILFASLYFIRSWVAVLGWPAFYDVADENVFPFQAYFVEHLCEDFAGRADERTALEVFIFARPLAHE